MTQAYEFMGDALNKTGRQIYFSICPHTKAADYGTSRPFFGKKDFLIYAPPAEWTAAQRHALANSLLVEYDNTMDSWYDFSWPVRGQGYFHWGLLTNIDSMVEATRLAYSGPGSWNDADMLQATRRHRVTRPRDQTA